uniref:Uncharacterized protein n=1 Tax=Rhizophora mucronata TaxID=61149 RepID=A0A2P2PN36_RHIMU
MSLFPLFFDTLGSFLNYPLVYFVQESLCSIFLVSFNIRGITHFFMFVSAYTIQTSNTCGCVNAKFGREVAH